MRKLPFTIFMLDATYEPLPGLKAGVSGIRKGDIASATPAKAGFAPGGHSSPALKGRGFLAVYLKIRDFSRNQGRPGIKSGAYMAICEHFYSRNYAESGKKINFERLPCLRIFSGT
ncbi:MAG: hypothetical protein HS130_06545 [Deltaproteobacteria bacterium]|nr:hypothetical protein [Deltaproteobacteria bacterium]